MSFNNIATQINSPAATHSVNIPAAESDGPGSWNIEAGDLLMIFVSSGISGVYAPTTPSGWTQGFVALNGSSGVTSDINSVYACYYKTADGTEADTSVNVQVKEGVGKSAVFFVAHKKGWNAIEFSSLVYNNGTSSPNPPAITPSWGAKEGTMFIATCHQNLDNNTVSAYPENYTNDNLEANQSTVTETSTMAIATREATTETEDPAAFSLSGSRQSVTFTIAIEPAVESNPEITVTLNESPLQNAFVKFFEMDAFTADGATTSTVFQNCAFLTGVFQTDANGVATLDSAPTEGKVVGAMVLLPEYDTEWQFVQVLRIGSNNIDLTPPA